MKNAKLMALASAIGQRERILRERFSEELKKKLEIFEPSGGIILSDLKCSPIQQVEYEYFLRLVNCGFLMSTETSFVRRLRMITFLTGASMENLVILIQSVTMRGLLHQIDVQRLRYYGICDEKLEAAMDPQQFKDWIISITETNGKYYYPEEKPNR